MNSVQIPAKANRGPIVVQGDHTTSFLHVEGFGSGAYSAKLLTGTRQMQAIRERYLFKFGYYERAMRAGADDLSDIEKTRRVLTIGLASDY